MMIFHFHFSNVKITNVIFTQGYKKIISLIKKKKKKKTELVVLITFLMLQ